MPYREKSIERKYYAIGDVAKMFNVAPSLLRFWEKEFSQIKPKKNKNGKRLYTVKEIEKLKIVYHLVKEKGYTLSGAKAFMDGKTDIEQAKIEAIESLTRLRGFLTELKEKL